MSSPVPNVLRPEHIRKLGPDLRRHLLQRGRQALRPLDELGASQAQDETLQLPEALAEQLRPVSVVIQAHSDVTADLERLGVRVRSVAQDGVVVITAEVPLAAIPSLLALPELMTMELAQPVPPAEDDEGRKTGGGE